jgi:hydrogenase expression/formation protein HypE
MNNSKKDNCLTGLCPTPVERNLQTIKLSEGSGGNEMGLLINEVRKRFPDAPKWKNTTADGASTLIGGKHLVFTSDSYVVTPIFFSGGNIGTLAFCGTVNDLAVMGARPIGLSLSLVLEEGFSKDEFFTIIDTIALLSKETGIPIVTGDTKVVERRSLDRIIINTSGIGVAEHVLDTPLHAGDVVIVSGGIGEHGATLLAKRFELEASLTTDSKPLHEEMIAIAPYIKQAKDITRGGLAAITNELAAKNKVGMLLDEATIPMHDQVRALTEILGVDVYSIASEGRLLCVATKEHAPRVLALLKKFNTHAAAIGTVTDDKYVIVQTGYGKKILSMPSGNIVPRIC